MSRSSSSRTRASRIAATVCWVWSAACALVVAPASAQTPVPAPAQAAPGPLPIEITGATLVEYDQSTGIWRIEGAPMTVTRGPTVLRAPRGRFDERARIVTAEGGVEVTEPGVALRANAAELGLADDRIRARGNVRLMLTRDDVTTTLSAPEAEGLLQARRFAATGGVSVVRGEWTITGRRLDYDDAERVAVVTGDTEVRFKDGTLTAEVVTMWLAREHARAEGSPRLRRGDLVGTGRRVDLFVREQLATLSGAARVERGGDRLDAEEIQVELDRSRATARGSPRVILAPTP